MPWMHTTNYAREDGHKPGVLVHRAFTVHDLPRLMLWCRLRGHRPVVDGYGPHRAGLHAARWVACDRCGVRREPQGDLDPEKYQVGEPYTGPWVPPTRVIAAHYWKELLDLNKPPVHQDDKGKPGPWPDKPVGMVGTELVVGRTFGVFSAEVKVGNAGSEHVLAAHLRIWPLGAIYLHTEQFGTWLQRRLNPTGYESRVISLDLDDWRLRWRLWAKRDSWTRGTPRWQDGSLSLDLVERIFGPKRYSYEQVGKEETGVVVMHEGDEHEVRLLLQRERLGRPRLRWRDRLSWSVQWTCRPGIPYSGDRAIDSWSVEVAGVAVRDGTWRVAALAAIRSKMSEMRAQHGYRPTPEVES
ncbi:hypothetical protein ACQP25_17130 [Microtetraspora malaysiensis]|uniref:hypothetical protein n=1 Tax=Microtetraspora malaysiensis TaxID=161358 RepID=UPI003D903064